MSERTTKERMKAVLLKAHLEKKMGGMADHVLDALAEAVLAEIAAELDAKDKRIVDLERALDAPGLSGLVSRRRHDLTVKELAEAQAEIDQLTPYALAQIARLRYASISDELEDAEDETERRAVGKELADWDQTTIRAIALMEARWERDRKTLVRCRLADMVVAACAKGGR